MKRVTITIKVEDTDAETSVTLSQKTTPHPTRIMSSVALVVKNLLSAALDLLKED